MARRCLSQALPPWTYLVGACLYPSASLLNILTRRMQIYRRYYHLHRASDIRSSEYEGQNEHVDNGSRRHQHSDPNHRDQVGDIAHIQRS